MLVVTPARRPLTKRETVALSDEGDGLLRFLAADASDRDIRVGVPSAVPEM
jgi:hypothetical protein